MRSFTDAALLSGEGVATAATPMMPFIAMDAAVGAAVTFGGRIRCGALVARAMGDIW